MTMTINQYDQLDADTRQFIEEHYATDEKAAYFVSLEVGAFNVFPDLPVCIPTTPEFMKWAHAFNPRWHLDPKRTSEVLDRDRAALGETTDAEAAALAAEVEAERSTNVEVSADTDARRHDRGGV
jgi:hypothetical protein